MLDNRQISGPNKYLNGNIIVILCEVVFCTSYLMPVLSFTNIVVSSIAL